MVVDTVLLPPEIGYLTFSSARRADNVQSQISFYQT
jgi:hypothetical protein